MDDDAPNSNSEIKRPQKNPAARRKRAIARSAAGLVPYAGAALGELANAKLGDPEQDDRERWEGEITEAVNQKRFETPFAPSDRIIEITGPAAIAIRHMIKSCPDGLRTIRHTTEDLANICDVEPNEIGEIMARLEKQGLITSSKAINRKPTYRLSETAYELLDSHIMGWSPVEDAKLVAKLVLQEKKGSKTVELFTTTGWNRRRFNVAHKIVCDFIGDGRKSASIQNEFVTRYIYPNDLERVELIDFAAS